MKIIRNFLPMVVQRLFLQTLKFFKIYIWIRIQKSRYTKCSYFVLYRLYLLGIKMQKSTIDHGQSKLENLIHILESCKDPKIAMRDHKI